MSLNHAILGLLTVSPMTGYDLKTQAFDRTIAFFWHADQSHIYKALSSMEDKGWVESHLVVQESRPNRKVYSITDKGKQELLEWLYVEQPLPTYKEASLIKFFFGSYLPRKEIYKFIERHRSGHQKRLKDFDQLEVTGLDDPNIDEQRLFWNLTLELGKKQEKAYLEWLYQVEEVLGRHPPVD